MKRRKPAHKWRGEHEYLANSVAKVKRRMEIYRAAGGEVTWFDESDPSTIEDHKPAMCQGCVETHPIGWNEGEWHHACTLRKKCDSVKCGLFVCAIAHRLTKTSIHRRNPEWSGRTESLNDA
jgi:hypothetical protein